MKKIIAFLTTLVMCLSLVACGNSEYQAIIDALDAKDYQLAVQEIYKLYQADQTGENATGAETEADPEVKAMEASAIGEWTVSYYYEDDNEITTFTVNEDGTATIGDESFTWELNYADKDSASFNIKNGDTNVYDLDVDKKDEGYHSATLYKYTDEYNTTWIDEFYRLDDFTKIEITKDNFFDYFEEYENTEIIENKDAFGEVTSTDIRVRKGFALKEECGLVISSLKNVPVEYSYRTMWVNVSADPTTGEYHLGEVTDYDADSEPRSDVTSLSDITHNDDIYTLGLSFGELYIDEYPVDNLYTYTDFELVRAAGVIYTYTPAE